MEIWKKIKNKCNSIFSYNVYKKKKKLIYLN